MLYKLKSVGMNSKEAKEFVFGSQKQRVSCKIGYLYQLVKFVVDSKSMPQDLVGYSDQMMQYVANNNEALFKQDIRLFHSGFPSQGANGSNIDMSQIKIGESNGDDQQFDIDLDEILMDFEYRVNAME